MQEEKPRHVKQGGLGSSPAQVMLQAQSGAVWDAFAVNPTGIGRIPMVLRVFGDPPCGQTDPGRLNTTGRAVSSHGGVRERQ